MVTEGYYDPHPRFIPERPLALTGFMGCGVAATAHALARQVGLALQDLPRLVEHTAGMTGAQLMLEEGESAFREVERRVLERIVRERPAPVIALGDGTLTDSRNAALVAQSCQLVCIQRPLHLALEAITRELQASRIAYPQFLLSAPNSVAELQPLYDARLPGYRKAELSFVASSEPPSVIARRIAAALGWAT